MQKLFWPLGVTNYVLLTKTLGRGRYQAIVLTLDSTQVKVDRGGNLWMYKAI